MESETREAGKLMFNQQHGLKIAKRFIRNVKQTWN